MASSLLCENDVDDDDDIEDVAPSRPLPFHRLLPESIVAFVVSLAFSEAFDGRIGLFMVWHLIDKKGVRRILWSVGVGGA